VDDGTKDDRANHHLDQRDEAIAQWLQLLSEVWKENSNRNS
jgi:hypothetical protein